MASFVGDGELAVVLSEFSELLKRSTWVFVPGDDDPWASAFSAGASAAVPREGVPDIFTNRIRRAFANAKTSTALAKEEGEEGAAVWTSNPARLSLFGPAHEVVLFRSYYADLLDTVHFRLP